LRLHVAERGFREANVVLDDAIERVVENALAVDFALIQLQAFEPRIGHLRPGAEAGRGAADVDPVRTHHREHQQFAAIEIRHVNDDVVEMLAGHRLMVGDDDVTRLEALDAVTAHAVSDENAEVGDEVRDAADILRNQLALEIDQRGAEIAHLIDHHIVGCALQVRRHFIGDRGQRVADHFQRDGVELDRLPLGRGH
jgi:hypothetical protein